MKIATLETRLKLMARAGTAAFPTKQLSGLMPGESPETIKATLKRALKAGVLSRVCHGAYIYPDAFQDLGYKLEAIAIALRHGHYSYLSLESALSEYGAISQIPLNRITVMTTGRKATYQTPFGYIEFTSTKKSITKILEGTVKIEGRPLRLARFEVAMADQVKVGRNLGLIDPDFSVEPVDESK